MKTNTAKINDNKKGKIIMKIADKKKSKNRKWKTEVKNVQNFIIDTSDNIVYPLIDSIFRSFYKNGKNEFYYTCKYSKKRQWKELKI